MDFDLQWLLIGVPLAFALGWLASRLDLRQLRRESQDSPRAYYKGLNLLLNEQQDKAIDAFIEAVQRDPDTTDLHFALGNLFRRRGEFERAVRVHQHLLGRADLSTPERDRAQHALAQDYMKAGLFDRAEAAYRALLGSPFAGDAQLALLNLYERSREWRAAAEMAAALDKAGQGRFSVRMAHHWCELAQEADAQDDREAALKALQHARQAAPLAARPLLLAGEWAARDGQPQQALAAWDELRQRDPLAFRLVALPYAEAAQAAGQAAQARQVLAEAQASHPGLALLQAMARLDGQPLAALPETLAYLRAHPSLGAAEALLQQPPAGWQPDVAQAVQHAVSRAAGPLQRYRCATCGFEAQRYFWQCPGCLSWDSFPPTRIEEP